MADRKEIKILTTEDLNQIFHGKSLDEGITHLEAIRQQAISDDCHRVEFSMVGEYDYTWLTIVGYRYETEEELACRVDVEERKRLRKIEKKRAQLEKIQAELEELEN